MVRNPGNPVMSPHAGISGHTSYNDNSGKKKREARRREAEN